MRKALLGLGVLAVFASSATALTFTEDFNSYAGGTTSWGSGGVWNEPVNGLKLDAFTFDGTLGPRTGNSSNRDAHAELVNSVLNAGEWGEGPITFDHNQMWDHANAKVDGMFVVLSDSPATAALVPQSGSLGSPINAIAIGHAATGGKNFSFFDGQTWTIFGLTVPAAARTRKSPSRVRSLRPAPGPPLRAAPTAPATAPARWPSPTSPDIATVGTHG